MMSCLIEVSRLRGADLRGLDWVRRVDWFVETDCICACHVISVPSLARWSRSQVI